MQETGAGSQRTSSQKKEESQAVGITNATRTHMRIFGASLTVFGGIKGHLEDSFVDVVEELKGITRHWSVPSNPPLRVMVAQPAPVNTSATHPSTRTIALRATT